MKKIVLNIEGMTCTACSLGLEKFLNKQNDILEASVNLVLATATIKYNDNLSISDIENYITQAGFKSVGKNKRGQSKKEKHLLIIYAILEIILMYVSMGSMINLPIFSFLDMHESPLAYTIFIIFLTLLFIIYGFDILKNGILNLIKKHPNMDTLVGIGVIVNFLYSLYFAVLILKGQTNYIHHLYFESSATIIFFVKLGRFIESKNKEKAADSIKNLVKITPKKGTIKKNDNEVEVTIDEIKEGDIVISKAGDRISVDGIVTKGTSYVDETFITGESKPVKKSINSKVLAGSYNYDGYIEYKATSVGKNSSISKIVDLVVEATNSKPHIAKFADKISGYFVPFIFIIAIITFIIHLLIGNPFSFAINSLVSVLVVACPCALGLATPLAIVLAISYCSKNGILVKNGNSIELINHLDTIVFDKTGTLTEGKLKLVNGIYKKDYLTILQNLEINSNHPIAKGIINNNRFSKLPVSNFQEKAGFGVSGTINNIKYYAGGLNYLQKKNLVNPYINNDKYLENKNNSVIFLFTEKEVLAVFFLNDEIKKDSYKVIKSLKKLGFKIVMLTGDNKETASLTAQKLGITKVISEVLPKEKLSYVESINNSNNVMMVGDGINDSPALKKTTVSISVYKGTDISADSSDIILLRDDLTLILSLFKISKKTFKVIKENLFWALFYNICMIPLATGFLPISLNPMIASLAMTLSSITVVLNSLRLLRTPKD